MKTQSSKLWLTVLVTILCLIGISSAPIRAQDETPPVPTVQDQEQPTAEATAAPTSTPPVQGPTQTGQSEVLTLILSLVEKIGYIIAFYLLFKSVPADKVKDLLKSAAEDAKKTETSIDDILVKVGQVIADALNKPQPRPGETVIETSVVHATDDQQGRAAARAVSDALKDIPG